MIRDIIDDIIYSHESQTCRECDLIVMHPKTWQHLFKEVVDADSMAIYQHEPNLKYKGIRVLRSLDLEEKIIEVR